MRTLILILVLIVALMLPGCATTSAIQTHRPAPVPVVNPQPMTLGEVEWRTVDVTGLKAMIAEAERSGGDPVFYVLTKPNYEVLAMNLAEMKRYIADQSAVNRQLREAVGINAK